MPRLNFNRIADVAILRKLEQGGLVDLLTPHAAYLAKRGVGLVFDGSDKPYEALRKVLLAPDEDFPPSLGQGLQRVNDLSTKAAMDALLDALAARRIDLDLGDDPSPADVALRVCLHAPSLLERMHAEHATRRRRKFEYWQSEEEESRALGISEDSEFPQLEADLNRWFEGRKKGRALDQVCRVFAFPKTDGIWFLVRHGDTVARLGVLKAGRSESAVLRAEVFDVVIYDPSANELRINAGPKETAEYRKQFGHHLFGDEEYFPGKAKYTLEPLRQDWEESLNCEAIDGIDSIRLTELWYFFGAGSELEVESHRAEDLFAAIRRRGGTIPSSARLGRAKFAVNFTSSRTPRMVTIRPSNIAEFTYDDDSAVVNDWLAASRFIRPRR